MVKYYQPFISLLCPIVVLTAALPQHGIDKVETSEQSANAGGSIDLPFLQFKNGGIRVNFAGYHAEAGLGGLLGGSDAKGGLFASAGTPWGPSASAGLGGSLGGQEGTARGGLHARAGLGNGRPEAAAGLGGSLDGSARSGGRARGGLYAGSTAGQMGAGAGLAGSLDGSARSGNKIRGGLYAGSTAGEPEAGAGLSGSHDDIGATGSSKGTSDGHTKKVTVKEVSHIQSVPPPGQKSYSTKSSLKDVSTNLEFKLPAANAKSDISSSFVTPELVNPGPKYEVAGANGFVIGADIPDYYEVPYPSRRYYRKRYRNSPLRKSFYKFLTTNTGPVAEVPPVSASARVAGEIESGKIHEHHPLNEASAKTSYGVVSKAKTTTLFDDIFNIPISTLAAVNQLLNNKSG